ncbi:MAG: prenyltransferase [Candidatus Gastranaerophilales bacterium]|nr:prenyltransferase [Candidatus Gastranaerophilales bacterium]
MFKKIVFWLKAARIHTAPMSILSWLVAFVVALKLGGDAILGSLAFIGILSAHLGVNLIDDYFDFKSEVKKNPGEFFISNRDKGKAQYLVNGEATLTHTAIAIAIYFGLASLIGLILTILCGWQVAAIAAFGAIFCLFYPKMSYWGLSEIAVGITFAPLLMLGTSYVMLQTFSLEILLISISTGLLTVGVLQSHALMDFDFDKKENKKTLCTIVKTKNNALITLGLMMIIAYINVLVNIWFKIFPYTFLLTLLTIPMAIVLYKYLNIYNKNPQIVPKRKFWFGPMENWAIIEKNNAQSFMLRFLLSRNLMMFFSFLICFGVIIA